MITCLTPSKYLNSIQYSNQLQSIKDLIGFNISFDHFRQEIASNSEISNFDKIQLEKEFLKDLQLYLCNLKSTYLVIIYKF